MRFDPEQTLRPYVGFPLSTTRTYGLWRHSSTGRERPQEAAGRNGQVCDWEWTRALGRRAVRNPKAFLAVFSASCAKRITDEAHVGALGHTPRAGTIGIRPRAVFGAGWTTRAGRPLVRPRAREKQLETIPFSTGRGSGVKAVGNTRGRRSRGEGVAAPAYGALQSVGRDSENAICRRASRGISMRAASSIDASASNPPRQASISVKRHRHVIRSPVNLGLEPGA
jgi:hypothetical protein